jgi:hypothetical protein
MLIVRAGNRLRTCPQRALVWTQSPRRVIPIPSDPPAWIHAEAAARNRSPHESSDCALIGARVLWDDLHG